MITNLRLIRMSLNKTQEQVAHDVGVSRGWYSLIEAGRLHPTEQVGKRLQKAFNRPTEELLKPADVEAAIS